MRTRMLLGLLFTVILAGGCASDSKKKVPDPDPSLYLPQTSIASVLANMTRAYEEMNYEEYRRLLDLSFVYIFAPQDIGGPNNIPPSWGLPDDLLSAARMFGHEVNRDGYIAESITLAFTASPDDSTDLGPNWRKVVLSNVNLEIRSRHETSGDLLSYQVLGDKADLYFVETAETVPGTSQRIWKIIRWEDKPLQYGSAMTMNTSWGLIKANFH
jgi:hypothetical protein